jgi:hypothetical protein
MEFVCDHCGEVSMGKGYLVTSEESGVVLLRMIVCTPCYLQAKKLGLCAKEIGIHDSTPKSRSTYT